MLHTGRQHRWKAQTMMHLRLFEIFIWKPRNTWNPGNHPRHPRFERRHSLLLELSWRRSNREEISASQCRIWKIGGLLSGTRYEEVHLRGLQHARRHQVLSRWRGRDYKGSGLELHYRQLTLQDMLQEILQHQHTREDSEQTA